MDSNTVIGYENDGSEIKLVDLQNELKTMLKDIVEVLEKNNIRYFAAEGTLLGAVRHQDVIPWDDDIDLGFLLEDIDTIIKVLNKDLDSKYVVQCFQNDENYNVTQPIIKVRLKNTSVDYDAWYDKNHCGCNGIFVDLIAFSYMNKDSIKDKIDRICAFARTLVLIGLNYCGINCKWLKERHIKKAIKHNERNCGSKQLGYSINFMCWKVYDYNADDFFSTIKLPFGEITIQCPKNYNGVLTRLYGDYIKIPDTTNIRLYHSKNIKLREK